MAIDLTDGPGRLRAEPGHAAPARVEREALRLLHGARRARPGLPLPHRGARRGPAGRQRLARTARAQGLRRPDAVRGGHRPPGRPDRGARDPARDRPHRRRRLVVRPAPDGDRLAAVVRRSPSRRRSRRSSSTAAGATAARSRSPRSRPRRCSTACSRARGIEARDAQTGRARPNAVRLAKVDSRKLIAPPQGGRHRQRQLHGRARAEGDRPRGDRQGHVAPRAPPSCGATSRPRASRSPASASSTARASRATTASPPASSRRCSSRSGTTRSCGRSCATRSRSRA